MQVLRYMVYIWEDYEKEMERRHPDVSRRKDFRYPPILPIIYYEGSGGWTAPCDLSERIFCGEQLGKYLPHFKYQLVRLHDYSNSELLKKGDEISLAMLINKIHSPEDMAAFMRISGERADEILKDTPEYLLDIMAKLLRALLYKMNLPEEEAESAVSKIKERKMSMLFENVTMDIQAERRDRARAEERLADAVKKLDTAEKELDTAEKKLTAAQKAFEIFKQVSRMQRKGCPEAEIKNALAEKFSLTQEEAESEYRKALEEYLEE